MATIKRNFSSLTTAWTLATLPGDASESYTGDVDLESQGYSGSHLTITITWDGAGAENVVASVYGSLDGTTFDDVAVFSQELAVNANNTDQYSFVLMDLLHYRIGLKHAAAETNHATIATVAYQAWNYITA